MPSTARPRVRVPRVVIHRRYSNDLKEVVIHQRDVLNRKPKRIACNLDMPLRVVQRCITTNRKEGRPYKKGVGGREGIMEWELYQLLHALLRNDPDLHLIELKTALFSVYNVEISVSTIWCALKYLGLSKKRLSRNASERDEQRRREYMLEIGKYPAEYLVFADESAVNIHTTYRTDGWAPVGERAEMDCDFVRGPRWSMLPAITSDGIIYSHVKQGSYNGEEFCLFLEGLMRHMQPYPAPRSVLVIDNCRTFLLLKQ